jgi:hypothetical protein
MPFERFFPFGTVTLAAVSVWHLYGDISHRKTFFGKRGIYLIAHFERLHRNAWPDYAMQVGGFCAIGGMHLFNGTYHNTVCCASPTCMYCSSTMMLGVVANDRYAISSRYSDACILYIVYDSVDTIKQHGAYVVRQSEKLFSNLTYDNSVHLMRPCKSDSLDAECVT